VEFRALAQRLTALLAVAATADLSVTPIPVRTPMATTAGHRLTQRVGVFPIIRAGLAMVDPILHLLPDAEVWHLGLYRDEDTLLPVEYYRKLPSGGPVDLALVVDPMLATGGSAAAAIDAVRQWGVPRVKLLSMIAAPEGIQSVHGQFPDTDIFVCAVDERLDERGYILPGLGDAGDRIFNTESRIDP
jgi:uracil phosphoribosyltransferase